MGLYTLDEVLIGACRAQEATLLGRPWPQKLPITKFKGNLYATQFLPPPRHASALLLVAQSVPSGKMATPLDTTIEGASLSHARQE
jgi:hypothetical protein